MNDPIQNNFILLGWLIAFGPILLGIIIGLIMTCIRFHSHQTVGYSVNYIIIFVLSIIV